MRALSWFMTAALVAPAFAQDNGGLTPDEVWELAAQLERRGDPEGAVALFQHLGTRKDATRSLRASAILRHGHCLLELERPASARERFEAVVREFADEVEAAALAQVTLDAIPPEAVDRAASVLDRKGLDLHAEEEPAREVARRLARELQVPLVLDGGAEKLAKLSVSVTITTRDALVGMRALAAETGTAFVERAGILVWTTQERATALRLRRPTSALKGTTEADEAALKRVRGVGVLGEFLDTPAASFLPLMSRFAEIGFDEQDLPAESSGMALGSEVRLLEVLDLVAFQFGLELSVDGGRVTLRKNVAK
jgi:hypothetical protein